MLYSLIAGACALACAAVAWKLLFNRRRRPIADAEALVRKNPIGCRPLGGAAIPGPPWPAVSGPALAERALVEKIFLEKSLVVLSLPPGMWGGISLNEQLLEGRKMLEIRTESTEPVPAEEWRECLKTARDYDSLFLSVRDLTVIPEGVMVELGSLIAAGIQAVLISFDGMRPEGPVLELCGELGERAQVLRLTEQLDREADVRAWMKWIADRLPGRPDPGLKLSPEALQSFLEMDWALDGEAAGQLLGCSLFENG